MVKKAVTGLNSHALAGCVPSNSQQKFVALPSYFAAAQIQKALDGCDRASEKGRRDFAILMMLSRLGLPADEMASLTLDDIDWRANELLVRSKGRQRVRMACLDAYDRAAND